MAEPIISRICTKCGVDHPLTEFHRQAKGKYGRRSMCKDCDYARESAKRTPKQKPPDALPGEEWRPVVGHERLYSVSSLGRVRSERPHPRARHGTGHVRTPTFNSSGYLQLGLNKNRQVRTARIHRLVAEAFLGPCPSGYVVNHKDGVKTNNTPDNLEYVTQLENHHHAQRMGLYSTGDRHMSRTHPEALPRGENHGRAKLTAEKVIEIRRLHATGESAASLATKYGVSPGAVYMIVQRINWKHVA